MNTERGQAGVCATGPCRRGRRSVVAASATLAVLAATAVAAPAGLAAPPDTAVPAGLAAPPGAADPARLAALPGGAEPVWAARPTATADLPAAAGVDRDGPAPRGTAARAAAGAAALIAARPAALHADPADVFSQLPVVTAATPGRPVLAYVPYRRTHHGLPVFGGDVVVVTDGAGRVRSLSTAQTAAISTGRTATLPAAAAARAARAAAGPVRVASGAAPTLVVYALGRPRLAWSTLLRGRLGDRPSTLHVLTDAATGAVLGRWDEVADGTGRGWLYGRVPLDTHRRPDGTHSLTDPRRPGVSCRNFTTGAILTGHDDSWGDFDGTRIETGCVDALHSEEREWDMFAAWFGRSGIDGAGHGYPLRVGLDEPNAYWSGSYVALGRNAAHRFIGSLDVVGHELGHALDASTPGGPAGNGVAEATGDIIGTAVEFFAADPADPPDFTIGEQINLDGTGPYRRMYDPALVGDPNCWTDTIPVQDPHAAAGPMDLWFTLLAKGSAAAGGQPASPTCDGSTVTGLGVRAAATIFYHAMLSKTTRMDYLRYRSATLAAAKNLYPGDCAPFRAVAAAWAAVSVPAQGFDPTCG
jgi:zinc metalloprotease ZmpA